MLRIESLRFLNAQSNCQLWQISYNCLRPVSWTQTVIQNPRCAHQCPPVTKTWETEAVMESIPNVPHRPATDPSWRSSLQSAGAAVVSRAPRGHSPHRRVAPAPPDGVRARWQPGQPRVYKAITACPGSWIIRVQADIMKVGCVLCVRVLQLHYCRLFTMQCWVSDKLCQRAFTSFLLVPWWHDTFTIWSGCNLPFNLTAVTSMQWWLQGSRCRIYIATQQKHFVVLLWSLASILKEWD